MPLIDTRNDEYAYVITTEHGDVRVDALEFYGEITAAASAEGGERDRLVAAMRAVARPADIVGRLTDSQLFSIATRVSRAMDAAGKG